MMNYTLLAILIFFSSLSYGEFVHSIKRAKKSPFERCQQYDDQYRPKSYLISCEGGRLTYPFYDPNMQDIKKFIQKDDIKRVILTGIKEETLPRLKDKEKHILRQKKCFNETQVSKGCLGVKRRLRQLVKDHLPKLRQNMALMSHPEKKRHHINERLITDDNKVRTSIFHPHYSQKVAPLTKDEKREALKTHNKLRSAIAQDYLKNLPDQNCVIKREGPKGKEQYRFKNQQCRHSLQMSLYVNTHSQVEVHKEKFKKNYTDIITTFPFLSNITLDANQIKDDSALDKGIQEALNATHASAKKIVKKIKDTDPMDLTHLLRNPNILKNYINNTNNLSPHICDMAENLEVIYGQGGLIEIAKDVGLAGASLIVGGISGFLGGLPLAMAGSAGTELIALNKSYEEKMFMEQMYRADLTAC